MRRYGIRTASDLESAFTNAKQEDGVPKLLDSDGDAPSRLAVIVGAIEDEEWMDCIRSWHGSAGPADETTAPAAETVDSAAVPATP